MTKLMSEVQPIEPPSVSTVGRAMLALSVP
jgi:hypothetical protein